MSRVSKGLAADSGAVAAIADLVLTYSTDDPGQTAATTTTLADGDGGLVEAEIQQAILNIHGKVNLILAALRDSGSIKS